MPSNKRKGKIEVTNMMKIQNPKRWRSGQTIFNFLEWLKEKKGVQGNQNQRLADTFHIPDDEMEAYIKEWEGIYK